MAIRKYVQRCVDGESELNLDVLSNVIIHANEFVRAQRAAAAARRIAAASSPPRSTEPQQRASSRGRSATS